MKFIVAASIISVVFASEGLEIDTNSGHSLYVQDEPAPAYNACPNFLYSNPVCGAVDVLSLACLDVKNGKLYLPIPPILTSLC